MSAVGTILLQSPGWNEGKARYETLGKYIQNKKELRRGAALQRKHLSWTEQCRPYGAQ